MYSEFKNQSMSIKINLYEFIYTICILNSNFNISCLLSSVWSTYKCHCIITMCMCV